MENASDLIALLMIVNERIKKMIGYDARDGRRRELEYP
jgi:hypothetical protein